MPADLTFEDSVDNFSCFLLLSLVLHYSVFRCSFVFFCFSSSLFSNFKFRVFK